MKVKRRIKNPALTKMLNSEGHQLVEWLNGSQGDTEGQARVAGLVRDVRLICESNPVDISRPSDAAFASLMTSVFDMGQSVSKSFSLVKDWVVMQGPRQIDVGILERTQAALARYSFKPALDVYSRPKKGKASFRIVLAPSQVAERMSNDDLQAIKRRASPRSPEDEAWIVLRVVNLAANGELHLVKECACGEWFFSARTNRRHCSAKCRQAAYEQKPGRKAKQRAYMRKYMRERYAATFGAPKAQSTRKGARKANGKG